MKTINKFAILCMFLLSYLNSYSQIDYTKYVKPIYDGKQSTALSIYDTNPESPSGEHICFIKYPKIVQGGFLGPTVKAEVIIKNRRTGAIRNIYEIWTTNHNGANAIWINDSLISFQVNHLKDFVVYNINTDKSIFGLINGELGHKSFNNILMFTICNGRYIKLDKTREPYESKYEAIYSLNCITGKQTQIVKLKDIIHAFISQNPNVTKNEGRILHVEPNSSNDKILFDFRHPRYPNKTWEELQGFVYPDGSGIRWIKERPMHVVWFDNNSMFGVDTKDPEKKIYQYDLFGDKLETLGGTACHFGASPNRDWYVGESDYYRPEEDGYTRVYLYKRGEIKPFALLAEWKNTKITWEWVAHVDPSFSSDGKRVYFIRASNTEDKFEAVSIDLSIFKYFTYK